MLCTAKAASDFVVASFTPAARASERLGRPIAIDKVTAKVMVKHAVKQ